MTAARAAMIAATLALAGCDAHLPALLAADVALGIAVDFLAGDDRNPAAEAQAPGSEPEASP